MAKQHEDTKPTLPQLQWLLERVNANRDPITREQVEVFGRHPGGPILPSECIAVERLPDTYGTRRKGRAQLADDGPVHDLAVSPSGELWIATVIDELSTLVSRGTPEGEHPYAQKREHPLQGLTHVGLLGDEEMGTMFSPRIIGFRPDGAPITLLKKVASCSDSEYWGDDALIFIGSERAFEGRIPRQWLKAVRVTPSGAVLSAHMIGSASEQTEVYRNGELLFCTGPTVGDLWEIEDRIIWTREFGELFAPDISGSKSFDGVKAIVHDRNIRDVFMRGDGALCYITTGYDGHGANLHVIDAAGNSGLGKIQSVWSSDGHTYLRGYEEFPNDHIAYIGETVRDKRECWVVDGVADPGFDHVTGLVFRAGRARYYGCLGRHLYTMELPAVTSREE